MKTIKLIFVSLIGLTLGLSLGFLLEEYFLYSKLVFATIMTAFLLDLIFSMGPALDQKTYPRFFEVFGFKMSKTFHPLVQQFKIKSLPIIGIAFGFCGYLIYFEFQNIWLPFLFLSLHALSYFRALDSYKKFGEFR